MRIVVRELLAIVIGLLAAVVMFVAVQFASSVLLFGRLDREIGTVIFILCSIGIPTAVGFLSWRRIRSRLGGAGPLIRSRTLRSVIAASYLLTWSLGVPAVHSSLVSFEVSEYKRMLAENNRVWDSHPRIEFSFDVPVLPFVILSYHEYQLAGLYGWGGWDLHLWSGIGATRIGRLGLWVS